MYVRSEAVNRLGLLAVVSLGLLLATGGCGKGDKNAKKAKQAKAVQLAPCAESGRCPRPLVCVKQQKGSRGLCVRKCRRNKQCSPGFRCTGRYTAAGLVGLEFVKGKGYCEKSDIEVGDSCTRMGHFCRKGAACWNGLCRKLCRKQIECDPKKEKCVRITKARPRHLSFLKKKTLFRLCVPATAPKGASCDGRKVHCQPGNECLAGKCIAACKGDASCDKGTRCHRITERVGVMKNKVKFRFRACVPATLAEGQTCSKKGALPLCARGHRCVSGRCARQCTKHEVCADGKACLGRAFVGRQAFTHLKASFYFCTPGARNIAPRATYHNCKRGNDCPSQHVCSGGRCRPFCKTTKDCPRYMGHSQRCRVVRGKGGKRWKACL